MCGIAGIFDFGAKGIANGPELIKRMNIRMAHRGPDSTGFWSSSSNEIYFGHQRLSILDLSEAGNQPMLSASKKSSLVFNGEIFNYHELKSKISQLNLKSSSDTEVLIELFAHNQLKYEDLNGMFSLAIWDEESKSLHLARDRSGQKPLYYTIQDNIFAFSSQLASLFELPWVKKELDESAFYDFLTFNQLSAPQTMFKGIHKFKAGHQMIINKEGIQLYEPFWALDITPNHQWANESQLEEKVFQGLADSVKKRMLSDVPVGAFLSGGVDSSAIVALMMQNTNQPIKTYSIGFEGQADYDELAFAASVSKRFGTEHYEKIVSPQDFTSFLEKIVDVFDEPIADSTCIPIYFLAEIAKENDTKVILTGDGADELFGGYSNWLKYLQYFPKYQTYKALPKWIKQAILELVGKRKKESPIHDILSRALNNQELFWSGAKGFKEHTKRDFLSSSFLQRNQKFNSYHQIEVINQEYRQLGGDLSKDYLAYLCFTGFQNIIPNLYANRLDRLTMAHSIEGRSPFLDPSLIQLAFQIPSSAKVKNGIGKYVLKKSLERILPAEVLYRKKMGFCVPLKEWGGEIMIAFLEENLTSFCQDTDLVDEKSIRKMLNSFKMGNQEYVNSIWTLYFFIAWYKKWFA